jgi:hypothetical protein
MLSPRSQTVSYPSAAAPPRTSSSAPSYQNASAASTPVGTPFAQTPYGGSHPMLGDTHRFALPNLLPQTTSCLKQPLASNNLLPQTTSCLKQPLASNNLLPQTMSCLKQSLTSNNLLLQTIARSHSCAAACWAAA